MKKVLCLGMILVMSLCLISCGESESKLDFAEMDKLIAMESMDFPDMTTVNSDGENSEEMLTYICDMEYKKVNKYYISYAEKGTADEVVVIETKKESDVAEAVNKLKEHRDKRAEMYATYKPEEESRASSGIVFHKGNCAVLVIGNNADVMRAKIEEILK